MGGWLRGGAVLALTTRLAARPPHPAAPVALTTRLGTRPPHLSAAAPTR
jgi:hypothetical protein